MEIGYRDLIIPACTRGKFDRVDEIFRFGSSLMMISKNLLMNLLPDIFERSIGLQLHPPSFRKSLRYGGGDLYLDDFC
jgi:hypothetical protein